MKLTKIIKITIESPDQSIIDWFKKNILTKIYFEDELHEVCYENGAKLTVEVKN